MVVSTTGSSSSSRPPLRQLHPSPERNETVAGELWTIKREGEDWPVVICDEEIVWTFFKGRVRPFNARQADGTWPEEYKSGGSRVGQRSYPAVMLGKLKFTWVSWKILEQFDMEVGQVIQASATNPLLAQSWREAMHLYALEDRLPELKKAIRQQRLGKGGPRAPTSSDDIEKIKRKGTPLTKYPPGYSMEEADDEEPDDLFVRQESSTGYRIKKEPSDLASFADMGACERSTDLTGSDSEQPKKKTRLDALGRSSMRPSTPLRAATQGLSSRHMSMSRATPVSGLKKEYDDPNKVRIYVGNPYTAFGLRRSSLDASPLLSKMLSYNPNSGWYIMSPTLSLLDKFDFMPVGQYLERGEYDPNILDEGTEWVRLETNTSGQEAGTEAMRCGNVYNVARTLELPGLQDLAIRKLKALAKKEPHQPFAILCVVDDIFRNALPDVKQYLVEYLADQFWNLVTQENNKFAEVMKADEELMKGVFGLLAGPPEAEAKIEAEEKIKDEKPHGEVKEEPESRGTVEGDKVESGLIGKDPSQKNTTRYHATVTTATDEGTTAKEENVEGKKAEKDAVEKDTAEKETAEKDTAEKMTAKELLTENDSIMDAPATILPTANQTVAFKADRATTGEIEGLSHEEAEMIMMALQASDRETTEKDIAAAVGFLDSF